MLGRRSGAAALLAVCAVGCGSSAGWSSTYHRDDAYDDWGWRGPSYSYSVERRDAPPEHGLTDAEVAAALSAGAPSQEAALPPELPVGQAAAEVAACYRRGDRERARAIVAADPRLLDWDDPGVVVSCRYVGGHDGIELTVVRTDASRGAPSRWPSASSLAPTGRRSTSPTSRAGWPTARRASAGRRPTRSVAMARGPRRRTSRSSARPWW